MIPTQEITVLPGVAPASLSAGNADGTAIDFSATYEADAAVALTCGVLGSSATALAKLQESDNGSTNWTDVATTVTAVKATDDGKVFIATGRTTKRYVRVRVTVATATSIAGAVILAKKRTIT
jgi:hypothetical protein